MDDSLRTGPERVPPGQYVTDKWPVLTYGPTPHVEPGEWRLRLFGLIAEERSWSWQDFQALPRAKVAADFHCVTRFSTLDNAWAGVATRELLRGTAPHPEASHVLVHCYGGYTTNLPLEDFLSERALVVDTWRGQPLPTEHGGPARLVVPHLYAWKSAKWISAIELLDHDRRGFWEENGYHTYGDPWREERFSSQEVKQAYQVRRRAKELGLVPGEQVPIDD